jgi:hypothetical protein
MDKGVKKKILDLLKGLTEVKSAKALGLDNPDTEQLILDITKKKLNEYLKEFQQRNELKSIGLEEFAETIFLKIAFYEAMCSIYLPPKE